MRFFFVLLFLFAPSLAHAAAQTATLNGAQISYEICGPETAPPVVMLHDGLLSSSSFDGSFPILCESFRVVRYDRRGYGKSPPAKDQHSPAEDLNALMKHVGFSHAHLIGAAVGAGIALDFLFEYPEAVDRLVFVSPVISGLQPNEPFLARLRRLDDIIRSGDMDYIVEALNNDPYLIGPGNPEARAKLGEIVRANPGDLGAHPLQRRTPNVAQRLGEIFAPTQLIMGSNDHPYAQAVAAAMSERMRSAAIDLRLESGQLLYLESPGGFAASVKAFLLK